MEKKKSKVRIVLRVILGVIGVILLLVIAAVAVLSILEYKPADTEQVEVKGEGSKTLSVGDSLNMITWNIGYGALGAGADFFMDGGSSVISQTEEEVNSNLQNILSGLEEQDADVIFLQESDTDSARSFGIDEVQFFTENINECSSFAYNYQAAFVPYPIPPIGKVHGGILTLSDFTINESKRIQLPCPFSWPVRTVNLKRCLLVSRTDIEGTDRELVLINLHLEAYDDGKGKTMQTRMLAQIMQEEYEKGNYVIAAGDFNQSFSGTDISMYPVQKEGLWEPGVIEESEFGASMLFFMDTTYPTCRSLDRAYDPADPDFQYYVIDGFIVSDNISVEEVNTLDMGFLWSDHNPVEITLTLKE